jgi:hypothetical protein
MLTPRELAITLALLEAVARACWSAALVSVDSAEFVSPKDRLIWFAPAPTAESITFPT